MSHLERWASPALAFGVTVACVSPFPDGAQAPRWAVISLAPLIALRLGATLSPLALAAVLYLAVTLLWSPDPWNGLDLLWHFIVLLVILEVAPDDMTGVFWAIGLGLAINTVVVMVQLEGWSPVSTTGNPTPGLFFNRNQQNDFVALAIVGLLSLRDWRAYALAVFVSLPLFTLPIERAPIVGLAAAGAFLLCRRWPLLTPAILILIVGLLARLIFDPGHAPASLTMRIETWVDTTRNLTFFGHGLGSFGWAYPEMEYAHNDPLQIAYELGAPGVLAALGFLSCCLKSGPLSVRLILIVFIVEGAFDFPLYQPASAALAAMAAGHLLRARSRLRRGVPDGERLRGIRPGALGIA